MGAATRAGRGHRPSSRAISLAATLLAILGCGCHDPAVLEGRPPAPAAGTPAAKEATCEGSYEPGTFPSASQCAACHEQIYKEWSISSHSYASISPVFHKFDQKINDLSQGTVGTFCVRCHASIGTAMGERRDLPLWDRTPVSREGVTCVTCHRVKESYGKVNGERMIVPGDITDPMYGGLEGDGVAEVVKNPDEWKVSLEAKGRGTPIHREGIKFEPIATSEFCVGCHQVAVHPGIKLEVVWDQYRASPAAKQGIRCQDCHMSTKAGQASGFAKGPVAVIHGKPVNPDRTHYDHSFVGPGYPISHPGIFPHNPDSAKFTIQQWLAFDYRAGWGTTAFEKRVKSGEQQVAFPPDWNDRDTREEAREVVDVNLARLEEKKKLRKELMEGSTQVDGPSFDGTPRAGESLSFRYVIRNLDPGHNLPSGSLGAQPEIWFDVALLDPDGKNVWESGYLDSAGDMADLHSIDVRAGKLPHDDQLVNLQTKFLTTNVKGTDREMYLPINFDVDQLPFIRPANVPTTVLNHPPFIRMEARSIPPLGTREASYTVPASAMSRPGTYRLASRLRSRAEPIYFMRFIDSTAEMEQAMNEWMLDFHVRTVEFEVKSR